MFFVRGDSARVVEVVRKRLRGDFESDLESSPLPSSYETLLRNQPKRKIAVSAFRDGWTSVVESKEVVDLRLAEQISNDLRTRVVVVQVADTVGARGIAIFEGGAVVSADYSEDDDDPDGTIRTVLESNGISHPIVQFREAVSASFAGWQILSKPQSGN